MRALTIHQPFAEMIVRGEKKIEYRTWSTSYRGPLAIHAGLRICDVMIGVHTLPRGGIVGVVELHDITRVAPRQYEWHLRAPRRVSLIPCPGRQWLWTVPATLRERLPS